MKKLLICMLLLFSFSISSFSQKIISDKNEIKELKEEVGKYTKIAIMPVAFKINVTVGIESGGLWHFYDDGKQMEIKWKTDIEVFNFMYRNGWIMFEGNQTPNSPVLTYIFEKKE